MPPRAIQELSYPEFAAYAAALGQPSFRAGQVFDWVYRKGVKDFTAMTSLPEDLRERLSTDFVIYRPREIRQYLSGDGTRKFLFGLEDGERIETALIPGGQRQTLCVSSQAGCRFRCAFCASGLKGFKRHLTAAEIVGQVQYTAGQLKDQAVTHIVFMGIGEPLDNYENVLKSIRLINAPEGLRIAARRITISTCGLVPQIRRLSREGLQIELSVSLHGYDDAVRSRLMPVSRRYPLDELMKACRDYARLTKRQITFEYILIKDLTCTLKAADALGRLLTGLLCKMNLIVYNPVREFEFLPPSGRDILAFRSALHKKGLHSTLRVPRGRDIGAACGQLRLENL